MAAEPGRIAGVVKNGVIHSVRGIELPEEARVEIVVTPAEHPARDARRERGPESPGLEDWEREE